MSVEELRPDRPSATTGWNRWRAVVSLFYVAASAFNLGYTLPNADEEGLFDGYADGAWFGFLSALIDDIFVPAAPLWMVLVVVFEVVVAALVAHKQRWVDRGILLSLLWVLAIMPFLAWPYVMVNVALALAQGALLVRTYDRTLWELVRPSPHQRSDPMIPARQ